MRFITQAAKVLNEQKKSKRRLAVFMCLAAVVALGTVAALKMYGQAMSHKEKRLICTVEAHRHTDACYDADGNLVCGQADYLVHTHNDDCYGADGELVCHLPEITAHTHTDACYTEEDVLVCTEQEQAHQHTDACYTPQRGELTCQMEEHIHGDDCYDSETGELTCQLEEHQHGDACYAWEEVLTCPYAAGGHQHSSDCYTKERGELTCPLEEHTHGDDCYDENGELTCQIEEHIHDDNCYAWEDVLTCQLEETPAGHTHTDACYEKKKILTCGQLELHTHTEDCYDENGALACGLLELKEHTHQEECFETVELTDEEVAQKLEQEKMEESFQGEDPGNAPSDEDPSEDVPDVPDNGTENISGDSTSGNDISGNDVSKNGVSGNDASGNNVSGNNVSKGETDIVSENDADVHEHDETCYDAAGGLMCGYDDVKEPEITQTYKDGAEKYIVTAVYNKDAKIPENAELKAQMITTESNEEYYAKREAEMREALEDENVEMDALFKIGFYVDGKEVEPEDDVTVTVQFLDKEGLADGTPMTIVHFGENGNEILGGSHVKDKSTTFKTNKFSDFAAIFRKVLTAVHIGPSLSEPDADAVNQGQEGAESSSGNSVESANSVSDDSISGDSVSGNDSNKGNYYGIASGYQKEGTEQQTETIEKEMTQPEAIIISGNYDYKGNGYDVTFHVEGRATISGNQSPTDNQLEMPPSTETESDGDAGSGDELEGDDDPNSEAPNEMGGDTDAGDEFGDSEITEDDNLDETAGDADSGETFGDGEATDEPAIEEAGTEDGSAEAGSGEASGTEGDGTETVISDSSNEKLEFRVKELGEGTEEHEAVMKHIAEQANSDDYLVLQMISYSMTYDGTVLNLSECKVTADISTEENRLKEYVEQISNSDTEDVEIKLETAEVLDGPKVNELGRTVVQAGNIEMTIALDSDNLTTKANVTPNPQFKVQYYANLNRIKKEEVNSNYTFDGTKGELPVIDTTGKKGTPKNGVDPTLKKLTVYTQAGTDSKGETHSKGQLVTETKLEEVYAQEKYQYKNAPNLTYFNKLYENPNYDLKEVWVLKNKGKETSTNRDDWDIYDKDKVRFTNRDQEQSSSNSEKNIIKITDETVLRLVYDPHKTTYGISANFYDYDITDGKGKVANEQGDKGTAQTGDVRGRGLGINSLANYENKTDKPIFAFGNANTGTGLWTQTFEDNGVTNYINKRNRINVSPDGTSADKRLPRKDISYAGCTFNMASRLKSDGTIDYNENIRVPNLFNEKGNAAGKMNYTGSLGFKQSGDEYTLSTSRSLTQLEVFVNPGTHDDIWTNNYWPMDDVKNDDPHTGGATSKTVKGYAQVGGPGTGTPYTETNKVGDYGSRTYPGSDDGKEHNNMFGMHYAVDFELTEDYVGPLDYLFFGDDDMWVFLDRLDKENNVINDTKYNGKLVCDLGGIHSSVGEYVDLWDYIDKDNNPTKASKYRLTFFYTERGLSGSTCFMQFTLPSVSHATPDQTTGNLEIMKNAVKINGDSTEDDFTKDELLKDKEFEFLIKLAPNEDGLDDDYSYTRYNSKGDPIETELVLHSGTYFKLKPGEKVVVKYLPIGMTYEVTEQDPQGDYYTDITGGDTPKKDEVEKRIATGTITEKGTTVTVTYKNKLHVYELPHTGGFGTMLYTIAGVLVFSLGAGFMYKKRIIERRR